MKPLIICFFSFQFLSNINAQIEQIETYTNAELFNIQKHQDEIFIVGSQFYLSKFYIATNTLELLNPPGPAYNYIHAFNRVSDDKIFMVSSYPWFNSSGTYEIYMSNDNAFTWQKVYDTIRSSPGTLVMFDSLEGIYVNSQYKHYRTLNGGTKWKVESSPFSSITTCQKFGDSSICVGELSSFSISHDRGKTWKGNGFIQAFPTSYDFISKDTILASSEAYFSKSFDGGKTWKDIYVAKSNYRIKHTPNKDLYMVGYTLEYDTTGALIEQGIVMKSTDLGETWFTYNTKLNTVFLDIEFINDSIAFISGTNGVLIKYNYKNHNLGFTELKSNFEQLSLYPNPTSTIQNLIINSAVGEKLTVDMYDLSGKKLATLFEGFVEEGISEIHLDLCNFSSGLYVYNIKKGNTSKFLKTQKL